jgi:23S rRNA pseudouridine2605 synthase
MTEERIQKIIARSGLCSRREAERLIEEGRVTVDGRRAGLGDKADPARHHIKVDGTSIRGPEVRRYLLLYKPREVMTTCDDPEQRTTVVDLVRSRVRERIYPVGRLDYHSEGLIILTNDGELAARVAHPRHGLVREYLVKIRGDLDDHERRRLMAGTTVEGHRVKPLSARRESGTRGGNSWWRIQVTEGRTHEVRELFFHVGHHVQRLRRTAIGPVRDDSLRPGDFRTLSEAEVRSLKGEKGRVRRSRSRGPGAGQPGRRRKSRGRRRSG